MSAERLTSKDPVLVDDPVRASAVSRIVSIGTMTVEPIGALPAATTLPFLKIENETGVLRLGFVT